ncbi:hypothetical protein ASD35_09875 [Pelomonas sp. Root1444]|nr:hypothetical protein ASD35_09875 [Pelomonas sp. Root1444]
MLTPVTKASGRMVRMEAEDEDTQATLFTKGALEPAFPPSVAEAPGPSVAAPLGRDGASKATARRDATAILGRAAG